MTCKLSRKNKKRLNEVLKYEKHFNSLLSMFGIITKRSYTERIKDIVRLSIFGCKSTRFSYYRDYSKVEYMHGDINATVNDINYDSLYIVPYVGSSIVKRSRIKNIIIDYDAISINDYNIETNSTENPVSMYFKIMRKNNDL